MISKFIIKKKKHSPNEVLSLSHSLLIKYHKGVRYVQTNGEDMVREEGPMALGLVKNTLLSPLNSKGI